MAEETFTPKVVLALIVKDGKFLLIKRKVPAINQVRWAFPGGTIGEAETPEDAVKRHAENEVGIKVDIKEKILERIHPDTLVGVVYFHCLPKNSLRPFIGEPHEIAKVEWVQAEEVLERFTSDVAPEIKKFILKIARSRGI